jgi:membrane-associated phospholipid phosphatase
VPGWRRQVVAAVAVAALAALALLAVAVRAGGPLPGEVRLLRAVVVRGGAWHTVWSGVATATDTLPLAVLTVAGCLAAFLAGHRRPATLAMLACGLIWLVNPVLKAVVARPRPEIVQLPGHLSEHSFPSGHAANSAVVVGAAALVATAIWPRLRTAAAVATVATVTLVAAAQLALARHYPSDLVAGWLLALPALAAVAGLRGTASAGRTTGRRAGPVG